MWRPHMRPFVRDTIS